MKSFPDVLIFVMNRFVQGSDYVMKKLSRFRLTLNFAQLVIAIILDISIGAPLELRLDAYRSLGPQPDEKLFPDDSAGKPLEN